MIDLVQLLDLFNRKERFILMTQASAGLRPLAVSSDFRGRLNRVLPPQVQVPDLDEVEYVLAMDFHLNWLAAAFQLAYEDGEIGQDLRQSSFELPAVVDDGAPQLRSSFERNQEDVDLLLGWVGEDHRTKLILLEAKAHTSWQTSQLASKSARFAAIFGEDGDAYGDHAVDVVFVLAGFMTPQQPQFMKVWEEFARRETGRHDKATRFLKLGQKPEVLVVGEHDATGNPKTGGQHWRVKRLTLKK